MKLHSLTILILLFSNLAFADESDFDGLQTQTAEEIELSENYVHQGKLAADAEAACADNKYSDICTNESTAFRSKSWQNVEKLMPVVAKVYALVISTGAKKGDVCGIIAAGVETASVALQAIKNKTIASNLESSNSMSVQAQSFYATADKHKELRKQTTLQAGGWAASAACYTAKIIYSYTIPGAGTISKKEYPMMYVKLAGSVAMGSFYGYKATYHNERYKELKKMAQSLPNRGDCNPVTATTCFCSEETSQTSDPANYQKYCVAQEFSNRPGTAASCVTSTGLADPNCNCKLTSSCITTKVGELGIKLGFGKSTIQDMLNGIKPLGTGFISTGFQSATDKNLAFSKKQLDKAPALTSDPNLNSEQKKATSLLASLGIPKSVAANLAKQPSATLPSTVSSVGPTARPKKTSSISYNNSPTFKKGGTAKGKKKTSSRSNLFSRKKKSSAGSTGIEIDNYMAKAQREAEITKDTSKPIFDIISYRYKKSAWREFQPSLEEETENTQK